MIKNVVTDPATGGTLLDTAYATSRHAERNSDSAS